MIALPWLSILADRLIRRGNALAWAALGPILAIGMRVYFDIEFSAFGGLAILFSAIGALFVALVFLVVRSAWRRFGQGQKPRACYYGLRVTASARGTSSGHVRDSEGRDCAATCSEQLVLQTRAKLTAAPDPGVDFRRLVGWRVLRN